jgi:hypothetical protein
VVVLGVLLGAVVAPVVVAAQSGGSSVHASVADARRRLDAAAARLSEVDGRLAQLEAERAAIEAEHSDLTTRQQSLARALEDAKRDVRQLAVTAYVAGGPSGGTQRLLDSEGFNESVWRAGLIEGQTDHTVEAAEQYVTLLDGADDQVKELVERVDQNRSKTESAIFDHFLASIEHRDAEQGLVQARIREAAARAPRVEAVGGSDAWARLRNCESGGNYQAVSPSGKYRGAYQFDLRTWQSVGGTGDPVDASPEEQDLRARILYDRSGARPWPQCGRFLP